MVNIMRVCRRAGLLMAGAVSVAIAILLSTRLVRAGVIETIPTPALLGLLALLAAPCLTLLMMRLDRAVARREAARRSLRASPETATCEAVAIRGRTVVESVSGPGRDAARPAAIRHAAGRRAADKQNDRAAERPGQNAAETAHGASRGGQGAVEADHALTAA